LEDLSHCCVDKNAAVEKFGEEFNPNMKVRAATIHDAGSTYSGFSHNPISMRANNPQHQTNGTLTLLSSRDAPKMTHLDWFKHGHPFVGL
jgi:predicted HD phosphohydrolase